MGKRVGICAVAQTMYKRNNWQQRFQGMALEVLEQVPEARTFLLPVGGGGLAAGFSYLVKERLPEARIIALTESERILRLFPPPRKKGFISSARRVSWMMPGGIAPIGSSHRIPSACPPPTTTTSTCGVTVNARGSERRMASQPVRLAQTHRPATETVA